MENEKTIRDDFLKELSNIGLGNAASSIAKMVDAKVNISLPIIGIIPVKDLFGSIDGLYCVVMTGIQGDAKGKLLSLFSDKTSFFLIDKMMGNEVGSTKEFTKEGKEAMAEFANIIGGAFLSSISNFSHLNLRPKIPETKITDGGTMKESFNDFIIKEIENALYAKTEISIAGMKVEGNVYVVIDDASVQKIFNQFQ